MVHIAAELVPSANAHRNHTAYCKHTHRQDSCTVPAWQALRVTFAGVQQTLTCRCCHMHCCCLYCSLQTTQAQPAAIATAAVSNPAAAAAATATAADPAAAVATTPAAKATTTAAAAAPGVAATASKPTVIPTKPLFKAKKGHAAVAAASIAGAKPANAQKSDGLRVTPPEEQVEQMNWEQLMAEDAPPTACRWEPKTAGVRWNVGCANKALGSSCNGMVLAEPPFCEGRGGSIATIKCLPDGEWGEVDALC